MTLPPSFLFSQSNLQDYLDCQRLFYLRHIIKLAWPSIESEPIKEIEHFRRQGELFHKLIHQFFIGIEKEKLTLLAEDPLLNLWWIHFLSFWESSSYVSNKNLLPEYTMNCFLEGFKLIAKYDLLMSLSNDEIIIFDWKTHQKKPRRDWLVQRLQTKIYPFTFIKSGNNFLGDGEINPDKLSFIYWFANYPTQPELILYSQKQYKEDGEILSEMIQSIIKLSLNDTGEYFLMTEDHKRCQFCIYRSLCDRGVQAGDWIDTLSEKELNDLDDFDFDQIAEIEF
jgi:hypothetical protein